MVASASFHNSLFARMLLWPTHVHFQCKCASMHTVVRVNQAYHHRLCSQSFLMASREKYPGCYTQLGATLQPFVEKSGVNWPRYDDDEVVKKAKLDSHNPNQTR